MPPRLTRIEIVIGSSAFVAFVNDGGSLFLVALLALHHALNTLFEVCRYEKTNHTWSITQNIVGAPTHEHAIVSLGSLDNGLALKLEQRILRQPVS